MWEKGVETEDNGQTCFPRAEGPEPYTVHYSLMGKCSLPGQKEAQLSQS